MQRQTDRRVVHMHKHTHNKDDKREGGGGINGLISKINREQHFGV